MTQRLTAITLQIPRCKQIHQNNTFKYYDRMTNVEQEKFITQSLKGWKFEHMFFEQTPSCPRKRLHMHGSIMLSDEERYQLYQLVIFLFKTPKYPTSKLICIESVYNEVGWHKYITKQQNKMEQEAAIFGSPKSPPKSPPTSPCVPFMFNSTEHIISTKAL